MNSGREITVETVCAECGGQVGWDAWADCHGELIATYDHFQCLACGVKEPELKEQKI